MDDLARFCCLNTACQDSGRRGANHLRVHSHCGAHEQSRILGCRTCGGRFSERKGTPLFRSHLPEEKAISLLEHLEEGCGVRQIGILKRKRLRIADFTDKEQLAERLMVFIREWSEAAHPFHWTSKSAAKVMAKCQTEDAKPLAAAA